MNTQQAQRAQGERYNRDVGQIIALAAGAVLMGVLFGSVLYLPWLPQLVVLVSMLVGLAFFTRPELSLLTFFGLRAVFDLLWWVPVNFIGLNVMELFSGACAGLALVLCYLELKRFNDHPAVAAFVPYLAVIIIGAFRNLDLREGLEILARYMSTFLFMFLITVFFDSARKRRQFFLVVSAVCAVPVLVSLYHLATGQMNTYTLDGYNRLIGGYKNLHNHALMMMFISTIGLFWLQHVRRISFTWIFALYALGALTCLYFTYVRTAMLGLAVGVVAFLFISGRQRALMFVGAAMVVAVLTSDTLQDRFADLALVFSSDIYESDREDLGSGRLALWTVSMGEFLKNPLGDLFLGLGLGKHTMLTKPLYSDHYFDPKVGYIDPHNDYLSLLYQMGPVAPISYIAMQIQVIRHGLKLKRLAEDPWARDFGCYMVAMCVTVFTTNFVSNAFVSRVTLGWYFWGLAGILFGESVAVEREHSEREAAREAGKLEVLAPG